MHYADVFISLAMAVVFPTSLLAHYCFVSMTVMHIKHPVCPMLFFPTQSFSEKRRKNSIFSRKFPFYKIKELDEQDGSDSERE